MIKIKKKKTDQGIHLGDLSEYSMSTTLVKILFKKCQLTSSVNIREPEAAMQSKCREKSFQVSQVKCWKMRGREGRLMLRVDGADSGAQ